MNITIYTINDCKFSQAEKAYLKSNNISFKEKNLESNREFLTEMLSLSNNFAGTPVTKVEKDDGETVILKGFTQEEFDKALGVTTQMAAPFAEGQQPTIAVPAPISDAPVPAVEAVPAVEQNVEIQPPLNANQAAPDSTPQPSSMQQQPNEMPQQPAPVEQMGPISLSADMPDNSASETPEKVTPPQDMNPLTPKEPIYNEAPPPAPIGQAVTPTQTDTTPLTAPATPAAATPQTANPDEQLNSVLQNLQSQVGEEVPENTDPNTPKPPQTPLPQS